MESTDIDAIVDSIEKFSPGNQDVMVIVGLVPSNHALLAEEMNRRGMGCLILGVVDKGDVFVLDEDGMERFGWVRKERLNG